MINPATGRAVLSEDQGRPARLPPRPRTSPPPAVTASAAAPPTQTLVTAGTPTRPPAVRKITASAARATINNSASMRRLVQAWQQTALGYYDTLGPIKFAGNFYSRALTKLRLFPAFLDDQGEPQETDNADARAILDRVQDPNGGRTNLLGAYGRLRFLVGESYLVCAYDEELGEKWEMLSFREIQPKESGGYVRQMGPGLGTVELKPIPNDATTLSEDQASVYRLWRPHPTWSQLADSPMMAVLEDCEEIRLAAAALRSRMRSRIGGNGMLVMADSISPPTPEPVGDEDMLADPFYEDLIEHTTASMQNEGQASESVPLLVRVADDMVDKGFKWLSFRDPNEEYRETGIRTEAIRRLGIGLDLPLEVLLGLADSSHWTAWQVDEQSFKVYLQPVCQELVDDFTSAYYRPAARDAGLANWEKAVIGYDAAEIINHPDRGKDAGDLYTARAIGKAAYRAAKGFEDADAPDEAELNEMIGVAIRDGSYAKYGIPGVRGGAIEPAPGEIENPAGSSTAPTGPVAAVDVEKGPPPGGPDNVISSAHDRILGAAELAVERARSLAGARLITHATRTKWGDCDDCKERMAVVPQRLVASALGAETVRDLKAPGERELVAGGADDLVQALARWGVTPVAARAIGDQVEAHAARTLYDSEPAMLPDGFVGYVRRLTEPETVAA